MFLGDLHIHSTFSDGELTVAQLVDLYGRRGFGVIGITDHVCETETVIGKTAHYLKKTLTEESFPEYIDVLREEAERAWRQYQMVVLPGFELSKNYLLNTRSAHIIALGCENFISAHGDVLAMTKAIREQNGLAIAAHPVSTRKWEKQTLYLWNRREELAEEFDAWEVASGSHFFQEVMESGLPLVASSDLHVREQMNSWKTVFECERTPQAIMDAIRNQQLAFRYYCDPTLELQKRAGIYDLILSSVRTTDLIVE